MALTSLTRVTDTLVYAHSKLAGSIRRLLNSKLDEYVSILDFEGSGDGATLNDNAWIAACAALNGKGTLHFPLSGGTNYKFQGTFGSGISAGIKLAVDPGVEFTMPDIGYLSSSIKVENPFKINLTTINCSILYTGSFSKDKADRPIWIKSQHSDRSRIVNIDPRTDLAYFAYDQRNDTRTAITPTATSANGAVLTNSDLYITQFGMTRVNTGEELTFIGAGGTAGTVGLALMVQCRASRHWVWCDRDQTASPQFADKPVGGAVSGSSISYQGMNTHTSYNFYKSIITVRKNSMRNFSVMLNGVVVYTVDTQSDILEFGAGVQGIGAITITNPVKGINLPTDAGQFYRIATFGDSLTADSMINPWPKIMSEILDGSSGVRLSRVDNYAVAGQDSVAQRVVMDGVALGGYNITCIMIGTNDIQGSVNLATYVDNIQYMVNNALNNGNKVIIAVPPMWYGQAQSGGRGQATTNFDNGKEYRAAIYKLVATLASNRVKLIDMNRKLGVVLADYVNPTLNPDLVAQDKDPTVYDAIHLTYNSRYLVAAAFAEAVLSFTNPPTVHEYYSDVPLLTANIANGAWTVTEAASYYRPTSDALVSLNLLMTNVGAPAQDNVVIATLPKDARPVQTQRLAVYHDTGICRVAIDGPTGQVRVFGLPAGSGYLHISCTYAAVR